MEYNTSKYRPRIIENKIQCNICKDIIESKYTHDFKWCECGNVAIDGGKEYMKRCSKKYDGDSMPFNDLSITKSPQFSIQEVFDFDSDITFCIPEMDNEEVILIEYDGVKRLYEKETGRRILMGSDYLNAKYEVVI